MHEWGNDRSVVSTKKRGGSAAVLAGVVVISHLYFATFSLPSHTTLRQNYLTTRDDHWLASRSPRCATVCSCALRVGLPSRDKERVSADRSCLVSQRVLGIVGANVWRLGIHNTHDRASRDVLSLRFQTHAF